MGEKNRFDWGTPPPTLPYDLPTQLSDHQLDIRLQLHST